MPSPDDAARTRLMDAVEADLEGVERALERLDEGTYFSCERCSARLGAAELESDPVGRRCPACAGAE